MLTFMVNLRSGKRHTVRATEVRFGCGGLELWVCPPSSFNVPGPRMVALFNQSEVESIVAKEFLVTEEQFEPTPVVVHSDETLRDRNDEIPF